MRPPLRIAILECDTPLGTTKEKYGGYGGVFTALLRASVVKLGLDPENDLQISAWDIVHGEIYPNLEEIDAILLTGSRHNSFDDIPWINKLVEFTQKVYAQNRVRIVGICFGHQIIARALGAKVGRSDGGWEVSVCNVELTDEGKKLFGRDKLSIQQMHRDVVHNYPTDVIPLGSSSRCVVQGMYSPRRLISVQGHPEFTDEIVSELLDARTKAGVFTADDYKEAMGRVRNHHDGIDIGATFLKFLLED